MTRPVLSRVESPPLFLERRDIMKIRFCPFLEKLTVVAPPEGLVVLFETAEKEIALQVIQSLIDMEPSNVDELMEVRDSLNHTKETIQ